MGLGARFSMLSMFRAAAFLNCGFGTGSLVLLATTVLADRSIFSGVVGRALSRVGVSGELVVAA